MSPSCIFMIKICFSFVAESILFISGVSGNFPCSFLVLIALLKNGQLCISKVSHFLNNKLCFYIYSNILCLLYIPKLPINKPKKKKNPFIFKLFWDSFLGGQLKIIVLFLFSFERRGKLTYRQFYRLSMYIRY